MFPSSRHTFDHYSKQAVGEPETYFPQLWMLLCLPEGSGVHAAATVPSYLAVGGWEMVHQYCQTHGGHNGASSTHISHQNGAWATLGGVGRPSASETPRPLMSNVCLLDFKTLFTAAPSESMNGIIVEDRSNSLCSDHMSYKPHAIRGLMPFAFSLLCCKSAKYFFIPALWISDFGFFSEGSGSVPFYRINNWSVTRIDTVQLNFAISDLKAIESNVRTTANRDTLMFLCQAYTQLNSRQCSLQKKRTNTIKHGTFILNNSNTAVYKSILPSLNDWNAQLPLHEVGVDGLPRFYK